ncbi:MBL fold metallo-hydrolase [Reichenbachiella sp. MALMAid0571]|uniref:MBL fold metallo-hydrolase n=1 Tax=Reichenbachiella sp. MALMAid0571 TaxID=3143939 RepID=UPI0032E02C0A
MEISFNGAAQTVTGSKHLITLWDNEKILLDCGMFQGMGKDTYTLNKEFGFDPKDVNHLILSHAHIDHSGLIPKLVKDGFVGNIYCTHATFDLCKIMLMDSAHIQEADARFVNKRRRVQGREMIEPLYAKEDVVNCLLQFVPIDYDTPFEINDHIKLLFTDNGHILGSATTNLSIREVNETTQLAYTGDIGGYNTALLKNPSPFPQADIIICESTYGDRLHNKSIHPDQEILDAIIDTCKNRKGKVIIPAFSLGRTQEIVYALNKLNLYGLLPDVKVYVDSPLAVNATRIMRSYASNLNEEVQEFIESRPDPFGFDRLTYITDKRDSQKLNDQKGPFILISSSGMAEAGRVKHHIMHNIEDDRNSILIVGYAEPLSLAGKLRNGDKMVKIFGVEHQVNAKVKAIDSLSAHGDYQEMIKYLSCQKPEKVRQFFLVHGEHNVQQSFKAKLKEVGFNNINIPSRYSEYSI